MFDYSSYKDAPYDLKVGARVFHEIVEVMKKQKWVISSYNSLLAVYWFVLRTNTLMISLAIFLSISASIASVYGPTLMRSMIDSLVEKNFVECPRLLYTLAFLYVLESVFDSLSWRASFSVACRTEDSIRAYSFDKYFRLSPFFQQENSTSDVGNKIHNASGTCWGIVQTLRGEIFGVICKKELF